MAESVALAVLENLVHMAAADFPAGYVIVPAVIPDTTRILTEENLMARFAGLTNRQLGDRWFESGDSAVLEVRSAVVSFEHNYLLNPRHPEFRQILVEPTVPFSFDERLFGSQ
jgi:RES domain-containing protein